MALADILTVNTVLLCTLNPGGKEDDEVITPLIIHITMDVLQVNNTSSPGNRTANSGVTIGAPVMKEQSKNIYVSHNKVQLPNTYVPCNNNY